MDVTPIIPAGKNIINGYNNDSFTINGEIFNNNILVFPDKILDWKIEDSNSLMLKDFNFLEKNLDVEILLLGYKNLYKPFDSSIRFYLKNLGIGLEIMNIGAVCRTYNILLAEDRKIVAALKLD